VRVGGCPNDPGGYALDVAVSGNYAYVADFSVLQVINVSNPTNCLRVGSCASEANGYANDVAVVGNYAYVADYGAGLQVIDVSNPTNPVQVGRCPNDLNGIASRLTVVGNYAYVADYGAGLQVIDVSNPTNPVQVGGSRSVSSAEAVSVAGNYAYVACYHGGLQVVDVSNPTNCVWVGGGTSLCAQDVALVGNCAFVLAYDAGPLYYLQVFDVSNPTNCVGLGVWNVTRHGAVGTVAVAGNRIYVGVGDEGLLVLRTLSNVQSMMRVEGGTLGMAYTIEASANLTEPAAWRPIFTTNPATLPFEFTDFDVRIGKYPQKFYRVRQP
jgi:hypothetical protein